jgi:hypothetical protein
MKRTLSAAAIVAAGGAALGVPISNDPAWTVNVYDTGGFLDPATNNGLFLGGLEVDPAGGTVYVVGHDVAPGGASNVSILIRSTGPGTAVVDPAGGPLQQWTRGNDLTYSNGQYYIAANRPTPSALLGGVYGFTPGVAGFATWAEGQMYWETSGLTFNAAGTQGLVTSDVGIGHHAVAAGTPFSTLLVDEQPAPTGYGGGADDHVITLDGRTIVVTDQQRWLYDITGGAGAVAQFFDLATIPGATFPGVGSRGTVDPATGDLFVAYATGGTEIYRIRADGSAGSIFATGFVSGVRDIDFGLASDGSGNFSLYATEIDGTTGIGSIYEFVIPGPSALAALALAGVVATRRRR